MQRENRHIILIGFMGTGKTTVGEKLATQIKRDYIDIDKEIELIEGVCISDIFSNKGENYFRQKETATFKNIINREEPLVVSTGGGIILSEENRMLMRDSLVILLQATPEEIYKRIKDDESRPLLDNEVGLLIQISNLLEQREELYEQTSNHIVKTDGKEVDEIVSEIFKYIVSKTC